MSEDGDETIDAGPEVLRAVQEAARLKAAAEQPGSIDEPVRVWALDDSDLTTDHLGARDADGFAHDLGADDADDLTTDAGAPDDARAPAAATATATATATAIDVENGDGDSDDDDNDILGHGDEDNDETVATYEPAASGQHLAFDGSFDDATHDGPNLDAVGAPVDPVGEVSLAPIVASAPKETSAARDFLRESRDRSEAAELEATAPDKKKRRSGVWIVLSVILGAQIIAGGVYFALNALGADDELEADTEEVVAAAQGTELIVVPTPSVVPTPRAAPTPAGTPTPVPPTPTWLPVSGGPRSAPFTFFVEAIVGEPGFFDGRDGEQLEIEVRGRQIPLVNPLASGQALVLRVVGGEPGDEWAQVELPGEASVAWVRSEEFVWDSTALLLQIDLAANSLRVFDGNTAVYSASVASGIRNRPTPQLSTYIVEVVPTEGDSSGRIRLANFGARTALADGLGALTLGPTDNNDNFLVEAGYTTDGQILLTPRDFAEVSRLISAGAKVEIVGVPSAPTPTPAPQGPGGSSDGSEGGFFGCPPATLGSPPNCYRVVERLTVPGTCAGLQVQIEDGCYLIGGNREFDAFGLNCQAAAPEEFNGVCYLKFGPVPQLPGPCPEGSVAVSDECREPA